MKNSLFGKVFVQLPTKQVGISSYHFDSIDNSYIRFDGWKDKRFPFSKKFENAKFDGKNRIFIGLIDWSQEGGMDGDNYWLYLMIFDESYSTIKKGYVMSDKDGLVGSFEKSLKYIAQESPENNRNQQDVPKKEQDNPLSFLNYHSDDRFYQIIVQGNTIDTVGEFMGAFFSSSDGKNSSLRRAFQKRIIKCLSVFRKEMIEEAGLLQLKNNYATTEVLAIILAVFSLAAEKRGIPRRVVQHFSREGLIALLSIDVNSEDNFIIDVVMEISDVNRDAMSEDFSAGVGLGLFRIIGSNIVGGVRKDYSRILEKTLGRMSAQEVEDVLTVFENGMSKFVKKTRMEANLLADEVLDEIS